MTRQLLAFLALLTGLAAVGAPVNAAEADALACEIGTSCEADRDQTNLEVAREIPSAVLDRASQIVGVGLGDDGDVVKAPRTLIQIDRAYE